MLTVQKYFQDSKEKCVNTAERAGRDLTLCIYICRINLPLCVLPYLVLSYICRRKIRKHNYLIIAFLLGRAGVCSKTVKKVERRKGGEKKGEKKVVKSPVYFNIKFCCST